MKQSNECANIELDYSVTSSAAIPTSNSFSINLQTALGDMYYKYKKFKIVLNGFGGYTTITTYTAGAVTGLTGTAIYSLGISGLDFIYNTNNGSSSTLAYFPGRYNLPASATNGGWLAVNTNDVTNGIVFNRPSSPYVTLNLGFYNIRNNILASGTAGAGLIYCIVTSTYASLFVAL